MRESFTWPAMILAGTCACEASPAPPPAAPSTEVPVASASAQPLAVEPAPPHPVQTPAEQAAPAGDESEGEKDQPRPPPKPTAGGQPFDRGSAASALGAVNVQPCATATGPRGPGRVRITFAPDGTARAVVVDGAPYAGTPVGTCILQRFRAVRVPPYTGADVTVGKSFTVK